MKQVLAILLLFFAMLCVVLFSAGKQLSRRCDVLSRQRDSARRLAEGVGIERDEWRNRHGSVLARSLELTAENDRLTLEIQQEEARFRVEHKMAAFAEQRKLALEAELEKAREENEMDLAMTDSFREEVKLLRIELSGARAVNEALRHDLLKCKSVPAPSAPPAQKRRRHCCPGVCR